MTLESISGTAASSALIDLLKVCRELTDEPILLYGSLALNFYGSEQAPVDIDLLVPDDVEHELLCSLDALGYDAVPSPYLGTTYKQRNGSIEIHDFQKYSDDFFLLASPDHSCKWEDLIQFAVDSTDEFGVKVPSLQLAFVLYAKYLHDWVYLNSVSQASPDVRREVDEKWPRLLRSFGDLLKTIATRESNPERFIIETFAVARSLSFTPAIARTDFYLRLLKSVDPKATDLFNSFLDVEESRRLLEMCDDQTRTKQCRDKLYFFAPNTGRLIEVTESTAGKFSAEQEFDFHTPHSASIQITSRCNLTCEHCAFSHDSEVMEKSVFKSVLTHLHSLGVFEVNLGEGGEATLHPNLVDFAKLARDEFGFVVNLTSNLARPLSNDLFNDLRSVISSLHCSFDDLHFNSVDYKNTLERNLNAARDNLNCHLGINIAYKSGDVAGASRALDAALQRFGDTIDQISVLKVSIPNSPWTLSKDDESELSFMFERIIAAGLRVGFHSCDETAARVFNSLSGIQPVTAACPAWREFVYVDVFGRVSPCGIRQSNHVFDLDVLSPTGFAVDPLVDFRDCQMCAYDCN